MKRARLHFWLLAMDVVVLRARKTIEVPPVVGTGGDNG